MTGADGNGVAGRWRSLDALVDLARRLPRGDAPAERASDVVALERWFAAQLERTGDRAFARLFADHLDLPGVAESDYLHRTVEAEGLRLLGGIRFYGQDVARPFVEGIAWTPVDGEGNDRQALWSASTLERLSRIAAREWRAFSPTHLRVHRPEDGSAARTLPRPPAGTTTDVSVHVADVRRMAPDAGAVALRPASVDEAVALVGARFEALGRDDPALARNVTPADADALAECAAADSLFAMRAGGATVGLIATLPGAIDWIEGEVVVEEVVSVAHAGRGHAAAAQRALAARYAREGRARRLIGTVDGGNVASRRSAVRAGRPAVSRYLFVPLPRRVSPDARPGP